MSSLADFDTSPDYLVNRTVSILFIQICFWRYESGLARFKIDVISEIRVTPNPILDVSEKL